MITHKELEALKPCEEGLDFAKQYPTLQEAWEKCTRSHWMWWLLQKLNKCPKELSIQYSRLCADHVSHIRDNKNDIAAAYAANAAYVTATVATAYTADYATAATAFAAAAAYAANDAAYTADYATAYTADYATADAAERKWQADQLRILVPTI